jgi:hypothetical protein
MAPLRAGGAYLATNPTPRALAAPAPQVPFELPAGRARIIPIDWNTCPTACIAACHRPLRAGTDRRYPHVGADGLQSATGRYEWPTGCSLVAICSLRTRAAVARSPGLSRAVARWPRLVAGPPSHAVLVMPSLPEPQPLRAGCA